MTASCGAAGGQGGTRRQGGAGSGGKNLQVEDNREPNASGQ